MLKSKKLIKLIADGKMLLRKFLGAIRYLLDSSRGFDVPWMYLKLKSYREIEDI